MIPRRYAWLLRDTTTLYTTHGARGGFCKLCDALERPGPTWHPHAAQARHLAAHRAEKITADGLAEAMAATLTREEKTT